MSEKFRDGIEPLEPWPNKGEGWKIKPEFPWPPPPPVGVGKSITLEDLTTAKREVEKVQELRRAERRAVWREGFQVGMLITTGATILIVLVILVVVKILS